MVFATPSGAYFELGLLGRCVGYVTWMPVKDS